MKALRRALDRLDWIELMVLGGLLLAVVANAAAGTWIAVGLLLCIAALFVAANYWRTEYLAEAATHDYTQHQLDEARAEVRRLSGDVVRWIDVRHEDGYRELARSVDREITRQRRERGLS